MHGKTSMAYPRKPADTLDRKHPRGWFVGWSEKEGRTVVFARLAQDKRRMAGSAGNRTRGAILAELSALIGEP